MKRGDIFHDGFLGYWVLHEKPNGRKLYLIMLNCLENAIKGSSMWHDPKTWNLDGVRIICNLYDHPEQAAGLIGDGNTLEEKLMMF